MIRRWMSRICIAFLLAMGIGSLPLSAYGPSGIPHISRLNRDLNWLVKTNASIRSENDMLRVHIERLQKDPAAIERVAYDELGYVHENDIIFQLEP